MFFFKINRRCHWDVLLIPLNRPVQLYPQANWWPRSMRQWSGHFCRSHFFIFFSLPIWSLPSCCWHTHASHAWYRLIMLDPHCGSMTCMTSMTWNHKNGCLGYLAPPITALHATHLTSIHLQIYLWLTHNVRILPMPRPSEQWEGRKYPYDFRVVFLPLRNHSDRLNDRLTMNKSAEN